MKEKEKGKVERESKNGGNNREVGGDGGVVGWTANVQKRAKWIAVNDRGLAIGESHPRAVLTDHEVDLVLELRAEGKSYEWLAVKFEIHKGTVAKICTGQRRGQLAAGFRRARGGGERG